MQKGCIKTFNEKENFGFITPDDGGNDVHFNRRVVEGGAITQGAQVEFETGPGRKPGETTAKRVTITGPPQERPASRAPGASPPRSSPGTATVPKDCVFTSFYGENGFLRPDLYFGPPQVLAECFSKTGQTPTQLRKLYQSFLTVAGQLRNPSVPFDAVCAQFGQFYTRGVVYQAKRGSVKPSVKALFDVHLHLVLKSRQEMVGFLEYLTSILCYFEGSTKDKK